jgi:uncharacterized protein YlxW (UPF0749 family)
MKINSVTGPTGYPTQIREKQEDSSSQSHQQNPEKKDSDSDQKTQENREEFDNSPEQIKQAVEAFEIDSLAQANGLHASVEGTGPGLKVVLKDGAGGTIRQFTSEEFLRLRQTASKDLKTRGKILDRKL